MTARHARNFLLMTTAALALAACQRSADTAPASTTSTAASGSSPRSQFISLTPNSLAACTPATAINVKWDLKGSHPDVQTIDIYTGEGASAKLFAEGGPSGESRTGTWVHPGTVFTLRDKADGKQLDEVRVGGPNCPE